MKLKISDSPEIAVLYEAEVDARMVRMISERVEGCTEICTRSNQKVFVRMPKDQLQALIDAELKPNVKISGDDSEFRKGIEAVVDAADLFLALNGCGLSLSKSARWAFKIMETELDDLLDGSGS